MPTTTQQRTRAGGFIQSESMWARSRDRVAIPAGTGLIFAGTVLGKITATGKYVPSPHSGSDGSQTAIAIAFDDIDATGDFDVVATVVARSAEVRAGNLIFHESVNTDDAKQLKFAQLDNCGIITHLDFDRVAS